MTKKIVRSNGITKSERYLQKLCEKAFLKMWSYPCVYRDQSSGHGAKDGKEVCDLLIVFGNHILIFSDKEIAFPDTGDIFVDWSRWYKKAILDSGRQIYGAERWIKEHPDRLFIDAKCSQYFPIDLPSTEEAIFHRIIVAHGASDRCKEYSGDGRVTGSLMIDTSIIGSSHMNSNGCLCSPFFVGQLDSTKGFIHVLDDSSLDIILSTLDTAQDFIRYLDRKEIFMNNRRTVLAAGEEELLAYYLHNVVDTGEHDFIVDENCEWIYLQRGIWENFKKSKERRLQIEADEVSYLWDWLIERVSHDALNDSQFFRTDFSLNEIEQSLRFLAAEPRVRRRVLSQSFLDVLNRKVFPEGGARVISAEKQEEPYYVFLVFPWDVGKDVIQYRHDRTKCLFDYCKVVKYLFPKAVDIVGIATELRIEKDSEYSEDVIYLDCRKWTEENNEEARMLNKEYNYLKSPIARQTRYYEYPSEGFKKRKKSRKRHKPKKKP